MAEIWTNLLYNNTFLASASPHQRLGNGHFLLLRVIDCIARETVTILTAPVVVQRRVADSMADP